MELVKFNAAKKALAAARTVDEVRKIKDQAQAMGAYAKQAKDKTLVADATEIRLRAERRLGEMMEASPKARAGRPSNRGQRNPDITLNEVGIDKNLAKRARAAAAPTEKQFEKKVEAARDAAVSAIDTAMRVINKAESRQTREKELADKITALPKKRYGVIYADPPWTFEVYSAKGMDRSAENHYPTMTDNELGDLVAYLPNAVDCVLFMWATAPKLDTALKLMHEWGFDYKSFMAWDKKVSGTGHIVMSQVELLLIGTRGKAVPPSGLPGLVSVKRGVHSAKPDVFAELIEKQYPNIPKLEMFARRARKGWDVWGNEAPLPWKDNQ